MKHVALALALALASLFSIGCASPIPNSYPVYAVGVIPPAASIAQEKSATTTLRSDVTSAEDVVLIAVAAGVIPTTDGQAAATLASNAYTALDQYDADYAAGKDPTLDIGTFIATARQEITALLAQSATPSKLKALEHAKVLRAQLQVRMIRDAQARRV